MPAGWPFLQERIHPFREILEQIACHHLAGAVVSRRERTRNLAVERLLAELDCRRTARQDNVGESRNFGIQPGGGNDTIDKPPSEGGLGIDGLAGQQHLLAFNTSTHHNRPKTPNHLALLVSQGFCNLPID